MQEGIEEKGISSANGKQTIADGAQETISEIAGDHRLTSGGSPNNGKIDNGKAPLGDVPRRGRNGRRLGRRRGWTLGRRALASET